VQAPYKANSYTEVSALVYLADTTAFKGAVSDGFEVVWFKSVSV
jgi:hypothetical protein